jgi:hypothetical protein
MKTKLTLSVNSATLAKARRKLRLRGRSVSAEVDAMLARIAEEKEPVGKGWIEQFGDIEVPLDLELAESDTPVGRQLRKTAAYKRHKAAQGKGKE